MGVEYVVPDDEKMSYDERASPVSVRASSSEEKVERRD